MPAVTGVWGPDVWGDDVWGANVWASDSPPPSDPPVISDISPSSGTTDGGTAVTITGSDFVDGATVDFDGDAATSVVFVDSTEITCVTPAHAAGGITVTVTNPDAQEDTIGFTYVEPSDSSAQQIRRRRRRAVMRLKRGAA